MANKEEVKVEVPAAKVDAKAGQVKLSTQRSVEEVVEMDEPEAQEVEAQEPEVKTPAPTPASTTTTEEQKPDHLKVWRMADGKLDEEKIIKDRDEIQPWLMAGKEAVNYYQKDAEFKRAYLAAQKRAGVKLAPEDEQLITPAPAPKEVRSEESVMKEYMDLYRTGDPQKIAKAESLWMEWKFEQRFAPKLSEMEKLAAEQKAEREASKQQMEKSASDAQLAKEWQVVAKKYDGIVRYNRGTGEAEWLDKEVAKTFIPLASKYPQESVDELMSWTLAKLGRLAVEPEPVEKARPRIASSASAAPANDKRKREEEAKKKGEVSLRISKQVDVIDEE